MFKKNCLIILTGLCFFFFYNVREAMAELAWLLADPEGRIIASKNAEKEMIPASILKIASSLYAIEKLGLDYRIKHSWYLDKDENLILKAATDPLLSSSHLEKLIKEMGEKKEKKIFSGFILDISELEKDIFIDGRRSGSLRNHDAPFSPFSVNFNTVNFEKNKKREIVSGEKESPLLDITLDFIKLSGLERGRIALPEEDDFPLVYAAYLSLYFLEKTGFSFKDKSPRLKEEKDKEVELFFESCSEYSLKEIIKDLMAYSNNLMANQLLLLSASKEKEEKRYFKKAREDLIVFLKREVKLKNFHIEEASGLSRKNKISPEEMLKILKAFYPYKELLKKDGPDLYKTGTLSDVNTRAGYIRGERGWYSYAVMSQKDKRAYDAELKKIKEFILKDKGV